MREVGATTGQAAFAAALLSSDRPVPSDIDGRPARRFAVHRNTVAVSLIEALGDIFPTVRRLVGDDFFAAMARHFIAINPPSSPWLAGYGEGFADFLATFPPAAHLVYLPDVARLERVWLDCYHEADAVPAGSAELGAIAADRLGAVTIRFHPATRILSFGHAAISILSNDRAGLPLAGIDPRIPEDGLMTRPDCDIVIRRLPPGGVLFLTRLQRGGNLGTAAEAVLQAVPDFDLAGMVSALVASGAVQSFDQPGDVP